MIETKQKDKICALGKILKHMGVIGHERTGMATIETVRIFLEMS